MKSLDHDITEPRCQALEVLAHARRWGKPARRTNRTQVVHEPTLVHGVYWQTADWCVAEGLAEVVPPPDGPFGAPASYWLARGGYERLELTERGAQVCVELGLLDAVELRW